MAETIDRGLFRALHTFEGAARRWAAIKDNGATDDELKEAIGREFGISGGSYGPGRTDIQMKGGKDPRFWFGRKSTYKDPPTLQGKSLISSVRSLMRIPMPQASKSAAAMPSIDLNGVSLAMPFATLWPPLKAIERRRVKASIQKEGILNPVWVYTDALFGETLIGGQNRIEIAHELGIKAVPVKHFGRLTYERARELALSDNRDRRQSTEEQIQAAEERLIVVADMRTQGKSTRSIATATGVSQAQARRDIKKLESSSTKPGETPVSPGTKNGKTPVKSIIVHPTKVVGEDGKTYPAKAETKPEPKQTPGLVKVDDYGESVLPCYLHAPRKDSPLAEELRPLFDRALAGVEKLHAALLAIVNGRCLFKGNQSDIVNVIESLASIGRFMLPSVKPNAELQRGQKVDAEWVRNQLTVSKHSDNDGLFNDQPAKGKTNGATKPKPA